MNKIKQHCEDHLVYQGEHYTLNNPFGCNNCIIAENNFQKAQIKRTDSDWLSINTEDIMAPNREFHIGSQTLYWCFMEDEYRLVRRAIWKGKVVGIIDVNSLYKEVGINFCFGMFRMFDNSHWSYKSGYKNVIQAEKITEKYLTDNLWIFDRLSAEK